MWGNVCGMLVLMLLICFDGHIIKLKLAFRRSSALSSGLGGCKVTFPKEPWWHTKIYGLKCNKCWCYNLKIDLHQWQGRPLWQGLLLVENWAFSADKSFQDSSAKLSPASWTQIVKRWNVTDISKTKPIPMVICDTFWPPPIKGIFDNGLLL